MIFLIVIIVVVIMNIAGKNGDKIKKMPTHRRYVGRDWKRGRQNNEKSEINNRHTLITGNKCGRILSQISGKTEAVSDHM